MKIAVPLFLTGIALSLTGCSFYSEVTPGYQDHLDNQANPQDSEEYLQGQAEDYANQQFNADLGAGSWACYWDPTMNRDWHDDYLCTDGASYDRPYLLPDDSFVERWEIDNAAAEYENSLNQ